MPPDSASVPTGGGDADDPRTIRGEWKRAIGGNAHRGGPGAERLRFFAVEGPRGEPSPCCLALLSVREVAFVLAAALIDDAEDAAVGGPFGGLGKGGGRGAVTWSWLPSCDAARGRRDTTGLNTSLTLARMASHCAANFGADAGGG